MLAKLAGVDVDAHLHAGTEVDALSGEDVHSALHDLLVELEVRHAVAQQAAHAVAALEHRDLVAEVVELGGGRQARWTRADHRGAAPAAHRRWSRLDPALVEGAVD